MNGKLESVPTVIPPALDPEETELAARNEFFTDAAQPDSDDFDKAALSGEIDEIVLEDSDAAPGGIQEQQEAKNKRRAKRRKSILFLLAFGTGFVMFVLMISWAFGFGFFAPAKRVAVDRNLGKSTTAAPGTSEDEKLKTALAIVANTDANNANSPIVSDVLKNSTTESNLDLKLSDDKNIDLSNQSNSPSSGNMIVLPDENSSAKSNTIQNQSRVAQIQAQPTLTTQNSPQSIEVSPTDLLLGLKANNYAGGGSNENDGILGRSVFFGRTLDKNDLTRKDSFTNSQMVQTSPISAIQANAPAFGTLLPVRFLGAIYTLRGAGGLVRLELTRTITGRGFSYPAGTVIIGNLRGSEYNRAFVTAIGLIDPKSGKLVKFEGEVLGVDGASGVRGTRKPIKSWGARFLAGLREASGQAVSVLTARSGRGGAVILGGTGGLGGEMSALVRGNNQENSFVTVRAGTEAYILVTDLPDEKRGESEIEKLADADRRLPGMNLSPAEMAEILTSDDPNKIRAALLKMSPEFRALAVKAMRESE